MNKLTISFVAALSLTTIGCGKKGGGAAAEALSKMEGFSKSMCDCKDKACADKVNDDMAKWGQEMAKNAKPGDTAKPDPELAKKSADVMTKYTECMTKLMMAGAGGGDTKGSAETKTAPPPDKGSATPPPDKPAAKVTDHKAPDWLAKVPAQAPTVKVGQMAWVIRGTVFGGDSARVDVDEVTAVEKDTVTTRPVSLMAQGADMWKHKPNPTEDNTFSGLPGLLVIPARTVDEVKPKVGDFVWTYMGNTSSPDLAHVKAVDGGLVTYETVNAMGNKLEEHKTDLIEPYGKGIAPWTLAVYKDGTDMKIMTVLAVSGDKVIGFEYGPKLVEQKKSALKPLTPVFKDRKVGDKVWSFSGPTGAAGEIKEVVIPKEVFKVGYSSTPWFGVYDKAP